MMHLPLPILAIIGLALAFDFSNGFHDAANSIATVVSTRVLSPRVAVVWAAFFNFVAFAIFGVHVAKTIAKGVVDPAVVTPVIVFAALAAALGLESPDLVARTSDQFVARADRRVRGRRRVGRGSPGGDRLGHHQGGGVHRPLAADRPGAGIPDDADRDVDVPSLDAARRGPIVPRLQLFSAAAFSLGHGSNDAQKTAGIITALLYSTHALSGDFHVPLWVIIASYGAIGLGTLSGGWRIVRTMGMSITKLQPVGGFCAETAGAVALFAASAAGIPVSTTHTITGAIVGVGATRRISAVKWGVAGRIVWAWVLTMPAAALLASLAWWTVRIATGR